MALKFRFVPPVSPGDPITSTQLGYVAEAINDRIRSNAGDWVEREVFYLLSLFRQIRNSDGAGVFPPYAEFFYKYQMLRPTQAIWPAEAPGTPAGANVASFMPTFVFGAAAIDLNAEDERIADPGAGGVPLWYAGSPPSHPGDIWELGKLQRGATDPGTGALASPSFDAAIKHYRIRASGLSVHGNSWGGYMPIPEEGSACSDPMYVNWQIFFTNIHTGTTYPATPWGSCPENPADVAAVVPTPRYYYIFKYDGSYEVLDIHDWIEGPYTGGSSVRRVFGSHLPRVLNAFAADFRGTATERDAILSGSGTWLEHAFDTQRFLAQQYHLAPARGTDNGDGTVTAIYPFFQKTLASGVTTMAAGTLLDNTQTGTTGYTFATGFVFASCKVKSHKLSAPVDLEFVDNATVIHTITVEPDGTGAFELIFVWETMSTPNPLHVRLTATATFLDDTGYIQAECSELYSYKPETHDLYLLLRLASCRTSLVSGLDGSGEDAANSNEISDEYFLNGCVVNREGVAGPAGSAAEINTNAVFDAARRLSQGVRMIPRAQLLGYEVAGGKSILYFQRMATGDVSDVDLFEGVGPAWQPIDSGAIQWGIVYVVAGSTPVVYNGATYNIGLTFTGVEGVTEFTAYIEGETPVVYEYDGIRATPPPQGFSNEWVMSAWLKVYNPDEASEWKPAAYSDYYAFSERCHFYHGIGGYSQLKRVFDYGENLSVAPEAFTGWRYAQNTNRWNCDEGDTDCQTRRRNRYKSCRIYEPAPELESVHAVPGETNVVKVTFKTRFHHHGAAPSSIARDVTTWDITALRAEASEYRTLENGIREYLAYQAGYGHCTGGSWDVGSSNLAGQGNSAFFRPIDTDVWAIDDKPYGACFPDFYFVKLMDRPYEDGNILQDNWDAPLWADWWRRAELKIRAGCEGFVDSLTSIDAANKVNACSSLIPNALFCYTFESLCFDAFGGKWFTALGTAITSRLSADEVRTDSPMGFGQLPNTSAAAACYNQVASALNKLNRVQIMLPHQFQARILTGQATNDVAASWPSSPPDCATGGSPKAYYQGTPPDPAVAVTGTWDDVTGISSSHSGGISCDTCHGASWVLYGDRLDTEWRWKLVDPDALYAVPEVWQDFFADSGDGPALVESRVLAIRTIQEIRVNVTHTSDIDASSFCGDELHRQYGYWFDDDGYLKFNSYTFANTCTVEVIPNSGTLHTASIGESVFPIGRDVVGGSCCGGANRVESLIPLLADDAAFVEVPWK